MPRVPIVQLCIMLSIELIFSVLFVSMKIYFTMSTLVIRILL